MLRPAVVLFAACSLLAQSRYDKVAKKPAEPPVNGKEITVAGNVPWTDTGIDVKAGDTLKFSASGSISYLGKQSSPDGIARAWLDMLKAFPVPDGQRGALVGRIGQSETSRPFLIGSRSERKAPIDGRLYLGLNHASNESASGQYVVTLDRTAAAADVVRRNDRPIVKLTPEQLNSVPTRVSDKDGTVGDRVNFFIVGSEVQVVNALQTAGWVKVDRTVKETIFRGILTSVSKMAYVTLPMSELYLFDRPQDYGWAHADPLKVVAARHHFRIWRAPFTVGGQTVWAGAGTHDVGFDKDQRNGGITHKIDPDTDLEREFIGQTLAETGTVVDREYMNVTEPLTKAKTAHGQEFHSDGRTLVIYMEPDDAEAAERFSNTFCSVLAENNPDGGEWGACGDWIEEPGKADLKLEPLGKEYRVLVIPGFMSSCFAESPAFDEGIKALRDKYGVTAELLQVANDASEVNAKVIAQYLRDHAKEDQRKWILVGYSKGTPDIQEALAKEDIKSMVAAFVSVAGASGGSPIADAMPGQADRWIQQFKFKTCQGDLASGFKSLARAARQAFLASYPSSPVPTYSVVASSTREGTSKALQQTWMLMNAYDPTQDGQLTRQDAIIPGSKYLGVAKGDHFAVALPFDKSTDSMIRSNMDKTRFPRAALLETVVRIVQADLAKK